MQTSALAVPAPVPSIPSHPSLAPPRMIPGRAPPSPRALAERAVAEAAVVLAAEEHCLAGAHEWVADAERTHSEPITWGKRKRVAIPAKPFTPERMAERRAYALARVAECERRVESSREALAEARRVLGRLLSEPLASESAP